MTVLIRTVMHVRRPAQRLLVQGVLASTDHLVRKLRDGADAADLRRLMSERRRMLGELSATLGHAQGCAQFDSSMRALGAAVAESDRVVEALIA